MGSLSFTSILPALSGVSTALSAANTIFSAVRDVERNNQALDQLKERQKLDQQQLAQNNALRKEQISLDAQQAEDKRRDALRRAVARQKVNFASSGIGGGAGSSSEAVLLGLTNESEDELRRRTQLDNLRNRALDIGAAQSVSQNVLQATQLAERNQIKNISSILGI